MRIVLASASPRRRELLEKIGLEFEVCAACGDEEMRSGEKPYETVVRLSHAKAAEVAEKYEDCIIIGADTVVSIDGEVLGKPKDERDASNMLHRLSGRTHTVYTGFTVISKPSGKIISDYEATDVTFSELSDEMIEKYIKSGEPMDKAGAYGIQDLGSMLVKRINGDYFNVVGLPVCRVSEVLRGLGTELSI